MANSRIDKRRKRFVFAAALMAGVFLPAFVSAGGNSDIGARIQVAELRAQNLTRSLDILSDRFDLAPLVPQPETGVGQTILVAQSRDVAAVNLRLSQIEEQMRVLVGQMEGLQFQMTQYQTLIERLQEDIEFRFQQLEGNNSGKTEAATRSGGAMPSAGLPQSPELSAPLDFDTPPSSASIQNENVFAPADGGFVLGSNATDPGNMNVGTINGGPTLQLGFDPAELVTSADADAQYRAGYEAVIKGDYLFAETQFRQFVALFPDHPQAADATNWLGEALLQRQQFNEAALVLFEGFQTYANTTRAPDLLLKLGIALVGASERDTACRTFSEALKRFPDMGGAYEARVNEEMARARC